MEKRVEYVAFDPADYVSNPIALIRIRVGMTQTELAKRMGVSQAYISKIEAHEYNVTDKLLERVKKILKQIDK